MQSLFNGYFVSFQFKQINLIPRAFIRTLNSHEITSGVFCGAIYIRKIKKTELVIIKGDLHKNKVWTDAYM